jgi:hypothetical protein
MAACLDVRAVETYDRSRWQAAGGKAGGRMRAAEIAAAEVYGLAVGLEEEVPDGITSIINTQEGISCQNDERGTHGG